MDASRLILALQLCIGCGILREHLISRDTGHFHLRHRCDIQSTPSVVSSAVFALAGRRGETRVGQTLGDSHLPAMTDLGSGKVGDMILPSEPAGCNTGLDR
jgi:hypothetical protein